VKEIIQNVQGGVYILLSADIFVEFYPSTSILKGLYSGGIYAYNIIQCPMEVIHGRQSSLHNVAAGGILGYIGVSRGIIGIPFVNPYFLYGVRPPGPALIGAAVVRSLCKFLLLFT
jgi:hypothetical protein